MSLEGCWLAGEERYGVAQQRRQQQREEVLAVRQQREESVRRDYLVSQREYRRARGEGLHQLVHTVLGGHRGGCAT